jgi:ABC-2 type transport system ATP-binding protein
MISAQELTRAFDGIVAVEGLTFSVSEGTLFALLGPNGAGKTTTVRLLMGLIGPTAGTATVAGYRVGAGSDAGRLLRRACGLLTEAPGFYERMSALDNLLFFGRLYGIPERTLAHQLEHYLRLLELWDRRAHLVGTFSKGMKQRLAIIRALFHDPKVVFLDEPTAGLDPEAALEVRELIARLKTEGRTIVVCTHNLDEAERLADSVGILRRRLLVCDTLARLRDGPNGDGRVTVHVTLTEPAARFAPDLETAPADLGVRDARAEDQMLSVRCPHQSVPALVAWLVGRGAGIQEVQAATDSLESIYLRAVRAGAER